MSENKAAKTAAALALAAIAAAPYAAAIVQFIKNNREPKGNPETK